MVVWDHLVKHPSQYAILHLDLKGVCKMSVLNKQWQDFVWQIVKYNPLKYPEVSALQAMIKRGITDYADTRKIRLITKWYYFSDVINYYYFLYKFRKDQITHSLVCKDMQNKLNLFTNFNHPIALKYYLLQLINVKHKDWDFIKFFYQNESKIMFILKIAINGGFGSEYIILQFIKKTLHYVHKNHKNQIMLRIFDDGIFNLIGESLKSKTTTIKYKLKLISNLFDIFYTHGMAQTVKVSGYKLLIILMDITNDPKYISDVKLINIIVEFLRADCDRFVSSSRMVIFLKNLLKYYLENKFNQEMIKLFCYIVDISIYRILESDIITLYDKKILNLLLDFFDKLFDYIFANNRVLIMRHKTLISNVIVNSMIQILESNHSKLIYNKYYYAKSGKLHNNLLILFSTIFKQNNYILFSNQVYLMLTVISFKSFRKYVNDNNYNVCFNWISAILDVMVSDLNDKCLQLWDEVILKYYDEWVYQMKKVQIIAFCSNLKKHVSCDIFQFFIAVIEKILVGAKDGKFKFINDNRFWRQVGDSVK